MNPERIQAVIARSRTLLDNSRVYFDHCRQFAPLEALSLMNMGAEHAKGVFSIGRLAHDRGLIDRSTLRSAVKLANDWLALDDEVLDFVAEAFPVTRLSLDKVHLH